MSRLSMKVPPLDRRIRFTLNRRRSRHRFKPTRQRSPR